MNLPRANTSSSDYTIRSVQMLEDARRSLDIAYDLQAKGKHAQAAEFYSQAVDCFKTAGEQLLAHSAYINQLFEASK
jgi:hypothetical protein